MIPRIFHRIWLGDAPMPDDYARYGRELERLHPGWELWTWHDEDVPPLRCQQEFDEADVPAMRADILRLELLWRFGGIYMDTDVEPLRPFDELTELEGFIGREDEHYFCNAVIGAVPQHPFIDRLLRALPRSFTNYRSHPITERTGPMFITRTFVEGDITTLPPVAFYPYHHTQKHLRSGPFPASYAVHHWAMSWGG